VQITIVDDDAATPSIAAVYVRGSTWRGPNADPADVTFKELLEARGWGDDVFGFRVDTLPAGTTLPWSTANQVVLRYTSPPTGAGIPSAGGVVLDGIRSDYSVTAVTQLDPQTFALTLDRALGSRPGGGGEGDRVSLRVAGGGPGGTAYALVLNPLQGDADRIGGRVNALDLGAIKQRLNRGSGDTTSGPGSYSVFADVTGDGRINALDFVAVKQRLNTQLPPLTAAAVAASAGRAPATPLRPASTIEDLLAAVPTTW
jgi:hypothetical protein